MNHSDHTRETPSEAHSGNQEHSTPIDLVFSPGSRPGKTEPCSVLSLSAVPENSPEDLRDPWPYGSVWQCPGCGFVIGIDECCDCR